MATYYLWQPISYGNILVMADAANICVADANCPHTRSMACTGMAYKVMAYKVMAYKVMAQLCRLGAACCSHLCPKAEVPGGIFVMAY